MTRRKFASMLGSAGTILTGRRALAAKAAEAAHQEADGAAAAYRNSKLRIEQRTADLLSPITLQEKVEQLRGGHTSIYGVLDTTGQFTDRDIPENIPKNWRKLYDMHSRRSPHDQAVYRNALQRYAVEKTRLGIPQIFQDEALHGFTADNATSFPQAIALGSTWDPELIERMFNAVADEAGSAGINQVFAPVFNVALDPRSGRTEETYGEDPYLSTRIGVAAVKGLQGENYRIDRHHVLATAKHYAGLGEPFGGRKTAPSNYSERTLREVFLPMFRAAVEEARVGSVMAAYCEINRGIPCHINRWLLTEVLRGEWGFDGYITSDGGGLEMLVDVHHIAADYAGAARMALAAGLDYDRSPGEVYSTLVDEVLAGRVPESEVDRAVSKILSVKFRLGLFENPYTDPAYAEQITNCEKHRKLALEVAQKAVVLLKNENNLLPLDLNKYKTIAVIGPNAGDVLLGGYSRPPGGQGVSLLQGMRDRAGKSATVLYAEGCQILTDASRHSELAGPKAQLEKIRAATDLARMADVVTLVVGGDHATCHEASVHNPGDRDSLELFGVQNQLVDSIVETGKPTVVFLLNGRPLSIDYVAEHVPAILEGWYLGQEGGRAAAQVLFGYVNPGGKLPITFPRSVGVLPAYYFRKPSADVPYLSDKHGPLFPFGHGLSYTTFKFANLKLSPARIHAEGETAISVDGPVIIPDLYNGRNRTFFFFGYQGTRYRDVGNASNAFVPTTAELNGDFSGAGVKVIDPLNGKQFPGNQIPTSRFDPASLGLDKFLPQVGGTGQVFFNKPTDQNIDEYILRIDQKLGDKDTLTGRYYRDHVALQPQNPAGDILGYSLGYDIPVQNVMVEETHTFRPNLLNQASFQYNTVPVAKIAASDSPSVATFGVKLPWLPSQNWIQSISVTNFFSINGGAVGPFNASDIGGQDNLSWVIGRHNLDFGFDVDRAAVNLGDLFQAQGSFGFTADVTNYAMASFLLGNLRTFQQGYGEFKNNRDTFSGFYVNDSFHATRRLTLNYGLRYEPYFPWKEIQGRVEQFRIGNYYAGIRSQQFPNAPAGLLFPGDPGMPYDGVTGNFTDFAPRGGFAYDLTGDGKTSVRGGGGLFYDSRTAGVINNRFADITPFSPQVSLTDPQGPFSNPVLGFAGYPFPATYPPPSSTLFPAPVLALTYNPSTKYLVPLTYEWDFVLERQLARNWMLETAYVGQHSIHNKETVQLNPAQYIPGSSLGTDQRRLFAGYGTIAMDGQDVNSNFNALEVTLEKHLTSHVSLTAVYTFSKALDDFPNGGNNNDINSDSASALPWYTPGRHQFDYGPSGFDHRHVLVVSYVWRLPALTGANRFVRGVLGSWEWSGIVTAESGSPFTVTAGQDQSHTGLGQDRGVQVAGVNPSASGPCASRAPCVDYLSPAAFGQPAIGTFGTLGKDTIYGPGSFTWDMGLFKNIPFTERYQLQFRAEFFNVFNNVNFNNPNSSVSSASFGTINGSADPRIGQLALKFLF